ncbi:PH and SEC7 domain-containing protein 4-like [Podarcis raffonei]|uniref:PH and SEC7 domain-containing protein 4-like n=1 Tax=Podarcis raffonei TaxID=65483 RepID=UPI00232941C4|nr:PH and SEC7 domain-containing protein 4-like [Podarcis raffonei]XP_053257252.1 PH and SEC7 domain-containing protein 4-like [Podarcis raffonei]XP_053257253.1 PH and SEC7 domain-containing protein 4-like [Podarcis raffonei]XP_053257254.1 PH and SEC7 domain-containing protein 4-like [Podarcis raffonei]
MVNARMEPSGSSSPPDLIDFLTDLGIRDVTCETGDSLGGAGGLLTPSETPQTETMTLLPFLGLEDIDLLQGSLEGVGWSGGEMSSEKPSLPLAQSRAEEFHPGTCPASERLEIAQPGREASQQPPENLKSLDDYSNDATKALFSASILQAELCFLDLQGAIDRQKEPLSSSPSLEKVLGMPPSQDSATSHEPLLLESDSGEEPEEDSEKQEEEEEDEGSLEEEEEEEEVECLFYDNPLFCASPRTTSSEGPSLLGCMEEKAFKEDGEGIPTCGLTSTDCAHSLPCQTGVAMSLASTDSEPAPEPDPGGNPSPGPYPSYVPHYRSLSPLVIMEGELESACPVEEEERELPRCFAPLSDASKEVQGFFPDQPDHTPSSSDLDQMTPPGVDLPAQEGLLFSVCSTSLVTALLQEPLESHPAPEPPSPAEISWASSSFRALSAPAAEQSRWQEEHKPQAPSRGHPLPSCAWVEEPRRTSCLQEEVAAADLHLASLGGVEGKLESSAEGREMVPIVDGDETLEEEEDEEEEEAPAVHRPEEPPSGKGTDSGEETAPSKEQAEPNGILHANGSTPPADQAAATRLATRLYHLDGFKRSQVASFLRKNNDFSRLVREAYLSFFQFSGQTLDQALRSFLKAFVVTGETQERERILRHFSERYHSCNPKVCFSPDAVHTLTCAIMLLNTDLHGQNIGRSMTCQAFLTNLDGLNDGGTNFPKEQLKELYHSIRQEKLEWAADDDDDDKSLSAALLSPSASGQKKANPFLTLSHDPEAKTYRQGLLARKVHAEADGKKTPWGKRGWKMFHTVLKGMVLYFSKDESRPDASASEEPIGVHHALAEKASKYTKRPHVFRLQTADWRIFLFQAPTAAEMSSWVSRINLVAAMFSSPPFPAAVGSQRKFIRPVLPTAPSKNSLEDQHFSHESWMDQVSDDLLEHQRNLPSKRGRGRDLEEYQLKKEYLLYEKRRYETYVRLLEVKLAGEDTEDLEQWEVRLGEAGELPAEEACSSLQKSHSSPSLNVDGLPAGVKVKRNISERRTVRKIIPRRNKHLL